MRMPMSLKRSLWKITCSFVLAARFASADDSDLAIDPVLQLVQDHREFATSFYQVAAADGSNALFSPYSISTCLSMLYLGARDTTADQMQTGLHLSLDRNQIASAAAALIQQLEPKSKETAGYQLKSANGLFVAPQTYVLSDFSHTLESSFHAKINWVNFTQPTTAVQTINQWVSDQTSGKITDLLQKTDVDENTSLVLTNAVYFQGSFLDPFNQKLTKSAPFYPTPDSSLSVMMMQKTASFPYLENDLLQIVALPFKNANSAQISLVIILPRSTENLREVENELKESLSNWLSSMQQERLNVNLPKFMMKKRLDLNSILKKMGMEIPFTTQADFSGIDGKLDLFLSKVVHEAYFALDEAGVIATASTAAAIGVKAMPPLSSPIAFIADHPFLFLLVDMKSQEILFMGRFQEPKVKL